MEERFNLEVEKFNKYVASFTTYSEEQQNNALIKRDHSIRVAETIVFLAEKIGLNKAETGVAFCIGLYHDIGRFKQLLEFNTFNDAKSVDHAKYSVEVLDSSGFLEDFETETRELIVLAIQFHNKKHIEKGLSEKQRLYCELIRDADKLDILRVLCDYYTNSKAKPNHTLTWEMPKGTAVTSSVAKQLLAGKLVSKENITNELDIKAMQLSWIYDINFKPSIEVVMNNRFLEKIYNSMPKNDTVIEMYRKIKVFAENKLIA